MNDEEKTKSQLIEELTALRKRIDELEKLISSSKETYDGGKQKKEALKESERHSSVIINSLPEANFAIDSQGIVISWQKEMEELTGVKAEEILGKGNYEYALPFYGVRRPILIDLILMSNEEIEKDYLFIQREGDVLLGEAYVFLKGKPRVVWGKAKPLHDGRGNVIGAIEAIRDVTERKQMEDSLRDEEKRYRELIEDIHEVIYIIDHSGRLLYISPVVETVFGYSPSELVGRPFIDFVFHEDLTSILENMQRIAEGRIYPREFRLCKKSGEICWVRTTSRLKSEKGCVTLRGVLTDITDQKYAEELYRTLADSSQAGIYIAQDGKIQYVNPHIPRYSGYSLTDLIGMDVLNIVHPEDHNCVRESAVAMLKGARTEPYEFRIIDNNGRTRWFLGTVTPITYKGKSAVLGNTVEITERKKSPDL